MKSYLRPFMFSLLCTLGQGIAVQAAPVQKTPPKISAKPSASLESELKQWQSAGRKADAALTAKVREQVNASPLHATYRPALLSLYAAQQGGSYQDQELNAYRLLNLSPQNVDYRNTLARLLYAKHGGATPAQVKKAYGHLNDAFNAWDSGKTDQALNLFRKARLEKSPELNAILAYHLRDAGKIAEAKQVIQNFKGDRGYLNWFADMERNIASAEQVINSRLPESEKLNARLHLGQMDAIKTALKNLPESAKKHWLTAKFYEKQGQYHPASQAYLDYYQAQEMDKLPEYTPVIYKAQLEDVNSLDLIALKFRTSPDLIRQVNHLDNQEWVETYRMLIVPVKSHVLHFPTTGYVSSHFGYRLHPIRGTWRLHEGLDIETLPGVDAEAAYKGEVTLAAFDKACGNMVKLNHEDLGIQTAYCHGEKLKVKKGQAVSAGQAVIETGNTGASASNHLHFGVQKNGVYTDPMDWL